MVVGRVAGRRQEGGVAPGRAVWCRNGGPQPVAREPVAVLAGDSGDQRVEGKAGQVVAGLVELTAFRHRMAVGSGRISHQVPAACRNRD